MKQQRNTHQRQLVLHAVRQRRDHPHADQIFADVRALDARISRGTVYRNLNLLTEMGAISHVSLPDRDRFDLRPEPHDHLLCTHCGTLFDSPSPYHAEADTSMETQSGFRVHRHRTVYEGICPDCQAQAESSAS